MEDFDEFAQYQRFQQRLIYNPLEKIKVSIKALEDLSDPLLNPDTTLDIMSEVVDELRIIRDNIVEIEKIKSQLSGSKS